MFSLECASISRRLLSRILEELGAAFFPTEAWGQPLTFDLSTGGLHHPALLHTALHGPHMVSFSRLISPGSNKNIVQTNNIEDFSFLSFWVHDDLCCLCKYRSLSPTAKDVKIGHMICFVSTSSIRTSASSRIPHLCDRLIWSSTRSSRISFSPTLTYLLATLVPHRFNEESNSQRLFLSLESRSSNARKRWDDSTLATECCSRHGRQRTNEWRLFDAVFNRLSWAWF